MKCIRDQSSRWSQHESLILICFIWPSASPGLHQLRSLVRGELQRGEGDQQHDGGPVLQDEAGPGGDVVSVRGGDGDTHLLIALLPVHWVSINS